MVWSLDTKIRLGFGLAVGMLIGVGVASYISTMRLVETIHWEVHTHKVLDAVADLQVELQQAETGQRGYLLTADSRYLEPYQAALTKIDHRLKELRTLTRDNANQQERLGTLEPLIAAKLAELRQTIELLQTRGRDAALVVVQGGSGEQFMNSIRGVLQLMETEENRLLLDRERDADLTAEYLVWIIVVAGVLGSSLLGLASVVISWDIGKRKRAEDALQRAHDQLDVRVRERTADLARVTEELQREMAERALAHGKLGEMLAEVEQSHANMLSIFNQLRLGTALTDEDGRISFLSEFGYQFIDRKPVEVLGVGWLEVFPFSDEDRAELAAMARRTPELRAKVPVHIENRAGRHYWMEFEVRDDPRAPRRQILFFYDVSEVHDLRSLLDQKGQFHELVGKSRAMTLLCAQIRKVARVDSTVLVVGETGSGKELVARAIHLASHRRDGPFIAVNLAGLTESLIGSQLFGHKRGAFTGAVADHQGFFEAAHGGTLFLDEIGDIPPSVQVSLLRVLEQKEIMRLGESRPRRVDVRILAATHHDLTLDVEQGVFRPDLLYRIRVARIRVPPLRERRDDIPLLVASFLRQSRATTGKPVHEVDHQAMRILLEYPWPGNVRELRSAIDFAVINCQGAVIQAHDLPAELLSHPTSPKPRDPLLPERERVLDALKRTNGNRASAARLLGISRATLYRRLTDLEPLCNE